MTGGTYGLGYVYFMRPVGMPAPVKIGWAYDPAKRLKDFDLRSPLRLVLAASMPGNLSLERQFHAAFRDSHSHGEWFFGSSALTRTIEAVAAGAFDVSTLPAPQQLPRTCTWKITPVIRERRSLSRLLTNHQRRTNIPTPYLDACVRDYEGLSDEARRHLTAEVHALVGRE